MKFVKFNWNLFVYFQHISFITMWIRGGFKFPPTLFVSVIIRSESVRTAQMLGDMKSNKTLPHIYKQLAQTRQTENVVSRRFVSGFSFDFEFFSSSSLCELVMLHIYWKCWMLRNQITLQSLFSFLHFVCGTLSFVATSACDSCWQSRNIFSLEFGRLGHPSSVNLI